MLKWFCWLLSCLWILHPVHGLTPPAICPLDTVPLFSIKGGAYDAGTRHSGGFFELEYKGGKKWYGFRPQAGVMTPRFHSLYLYGGIAVDIYFTQTFVVTPSFSPGLPFPRK